VYTAEDGRDEGKMVDFAYLQALHDVLSQTALNFDDVHYTLLREMPQTYTFSSFAA
jgi:hypothetical protein